MSCAKINHFACVSYKIFFSFQLQKATILDYFLKINKFSFMIILIPVFITSYKIITLFITS